MKKNNFDVVEDFVFMPIREYTGVDLGGQIAIPRSEIKERLKEISRAYESGDLSSICDPGLRAR